MDIRNIEIKIDAGDTGKDTFMVEVEIADRSQPYLPYEKLERLEEAIHAAILSTLVEAPHRHFQPRRETAHVGGEGETISVAR